MVYVDLAFILTVFEPDLLVDESPGPEITQLFTSLVLQEITELLPGRTRFGFAEISTLELPLVTGVPKSPGIPGPGVPGVPGVPGMTGLTCCVLTQLLPFQNGALLGHTVSTGVSTGWALTQLVPFHVWAPEHTVTVTD